MSRLDPEEDVKAINPAKVFYKWNADEEQGLFEYYDKNKKDEPSKGKIKVPLPFTFLPISRCITLKGYDDDRKITYWSNEVKDITKEPFKIQSASGIGQNKVIKEVITGLYKDIKKDVEALDISYIESLYIGVKNANKTLDLCNVQIRGAALGPWFEFCKSNKIWTIAVQVKSFIDKKKGKVKYREPVFTAINKISEEMNEEAKKLNIILNDYLKEYFAKNSESISNPLSNTTTETNKSEEAFDDSKHKDAQHSKKTTAKEEVVEDDANDINYGDPNAPDEF